MNEPLPDGPDSPAAGAGGASGAPFSAGALLRAAREREGLHIAVLAATIKVAPAKLEALEQDRYEQLPNPTFARALAQSVCRSLKIDPRPVLALLPQLEMPPLEGSLSRLNTPFQEGTSRGVGAGLAWASKPMFWAGGLLLLAAVVVGLVPPDLIDGWTSTAIQASLPASSPRQASLAAASAALAAPEAASEARPASSGTTAALIESAPPKVAPPSAAASLLTASAGVAVPAAAAGAGLLRLSASADSWVEVLDVQGRPVFSRIVQRGEAVALDAPPPLRVRVGNASGTTLAFRGQVLDLAPYTRDNVARLELR